MASVAFHRVLDETKVNAALIREVVNDGYRRVNWNDEEVNSDPEYMKNLVRSMAEEARLKTADAPGSSIKLRTFINNVVEGFATSPEGIDQLRKRSVLVQVAILTVDMPAEVRGGRVQRLQRHLPRGRSGRRARGRALLRCRRGQPQKALPACKTPISTSSAQPSACAPTSGTALWPTTCVP